MSDASGMLLLDVKNRCWSEEMIEITGIKREQLAALYESYEVVGELKEETAKELGLPGKVKVIAGGGDQAVGAVGTGTVGHGMCSVALGTVSYTHLDVYKRQIFYRNIMKTAMQIPPMRKKSLGNTESFCPFCIQRFEE